MKSVTVDGTNLAYTDQGAGPSILLVHGFPLDMRIWTAVADALAGGFRVVRVDLRGFGQSTLGSGFTLEKLADDLNRFAAAVKLEKFLFAGLSMGGYVGLAYASKYESTLAGLCLVDSKAAADNDEQKKGRDRMIALVKTGGSKAIADDMLGKMTAEETIRTQPQVVRDLRDIMEACPPRTIETALAAMRDRNDYSHVPASLKVPFHIIVGQGDVITPPKVAEQVAAGVAGAGPTVIPAAGHLSSMEQPAQVAAAIAAFADRCLKP